jgi:hypothetical protein
VSNVNVLAVIVSTIVAFLIGGAWYGAMFKNVWIAAHGFTPERLDAMRKERSPALTMGIGFVLQLVTAFGLALLIGWTGYQTWAHGLAIGVFVWFFFTAAVNLMACLYQGKPLIAFAVDAGYQLVYFALMGAIIGAWR